jgi:hypothetical protein
LLLGLLAEAEEPFRCCNPLSTAAKGRFVCKTLCPEHRCRDLGPKAEETLTKLTNSSCAKLVRLHGLKLSGDVCCPLRLRLLRKEFLSTELLSCQTLSKTPKELSLSLLLAGGRKQGVDVCLALLFCKAGAELALPNVLGLCCKQRLQILCPLLLPKGSTEL